MYLGIKSLSLFLTSRISSVMFSLRGPRALESPSFQFRAIDEREVDNSASALTILDLGVVSNREQKL